MIDKLLLPFDLLSDPDGSKAIQPYGVWDDQGTIARPALFVTDREGIVRYRYVGRDFADRPKDDVVLEAVHGSR